MTRTIAHIYFSALHNDSRSFRAAKAGLQAEIAERELLIGYWEPELPQSSFPMPGMEIQRLKPPSFDALPRVVGRALRWFLWRNISTRALIAAQPILLQAHSLAALPPAVAAKKVLSVPLIYDARELETERNGWKRLQKFVARRIESRLIRHADQVLVVSEMIADWYRDTYGLDNVTVVRNVPERPSYEITRNRKIRDDFQLDDDALVFIYLGALSNGRGWTQIVDAFRDQPRDRHIIFVGDGPDAQKIADISKTVPNVHWHAPVPITQVPQYAAGADVGISLIEDSCLSYRFCLPNKLHEYRIAGLPVIVSDLPELSRFIRQANCGWTTPGDSASLAELVRSLDRSKIRAKADGATQAPLTWDDEKDAYIKLSRNLLDKKPDGITPRRFFPGS
jgi:glycosyltransferase involved in cell wall biosynthesis